MAISTIGSSTSSGGGAQPYEQIFTSSGTWVKPAGVKTVEVTCVGGSAGATTSYYASGAGGYNKAILDVSAYSSIPVTVGAAGTYNTNGGKSSFGTLMAAGGSVVGTGQMGPIIYSGLGPINTGTTILSTPYGGIVASYVNGYYYLVPGNNNVSTIYRTTDLTAGSGSWTSMSLPVAMNYGYYNSTDRDDHLKVVYGNGVYAFIEWGQNKVYYSTNGTTWQTSTPGFTVQGIAFGNGKFVIHGNTAISYSTNCASWTSASTGSFSINSGFYTGVKYLNNLFVMTDQNAGYYNGYIWWSTDGVTWSKISNQYIGTANPGSMGPILYSPKTNRFYAYTVYTNYSNTQNMLNNFYAFTINTSTNQAENWETLSTSQPNYGYNSNIPAMTVFSDGNIYVNKARYSTTAVVEKFDVTAKTWSTFITYASNSDWPSSLLDDGTGNVFDFAGSTTNGLRWTQMLNGVAGETSPYNSSNVNSVSAGAGGPALSIPISNSTYAYFPGPGSPEGWARGAAQSSTPPTNAYGSGVYGANVAGRQGVVRVRWWV